VEVSVNLENNQREFLRKVSVSLIRNNQDETGAFVASPSFSQYSYSWLRDGTYIAYSLLIKGYYEEVEAYIQWVVGVIERYAHKVDRLPNLLASSQDKQNNWFLSARYTLEGNEDTSDWPNFQIDGYGSFLWLVARYLGAKGIALPSDWIKACDTVITYLQLVWNQPNSDCWEEFEGYIHPATLACLVGGLTSIESYVTSEKAAQCKTLATTITSYILEHAHPDGYFPKYIGSDLIDASLVWLSEPYNVIRADHPFLIKTIEKIEQDITIEGGVKRYSEDTYYGGGQWIILSAFLGLYYVKVGNLKRANELMDWILKQQEHEGFLPEQVLTRVNDPSMIRPWEERWGKVATPLLWSHAMYLIFDDALSSYTQKEDTQYV
jgi:GH15 family glucan-1,4-alpha-glucosidase